MARCPDGAWQDDATPTQAFLEQLPSIAGEIRECVAREDTVTLRRVLHRLVGSAGMYGLFPVSAPAASLLARLNRENPPPSVKGESSLAESVLELVLACERAAKAGAV